jgi:undecaprenyl-diphosphatase
LSGVRRDAAADFSFYIAVPAILGAAVLHAKDLLEQGAGDVAPGPLLAGAATAFIVGVCALEALLKLVTRQKLHWFAWYCGIAGVATILWQVMS